MDRTTLVGLAFVLFAAACNSGGSDTKDECGPDNPCAAGFECSPTQPRKCISKEGVDTKVDFAVTITGSGSVKVGDQTPCTTGTCSYKVSKGLPTSLTATANAGSRFSAWTGDCSGSSSTISVVMDKGKSCGATFAAADQASYSVTVGADTGGTVSSTQLTCTGSSCSGKVPTGNNVTISATPGDGYRFDAWRGSSECDSKTSNPLTFAISGDVECRATFVQTFNVAASTTTPGATVTVSFGTCTGASCAVDKGGNVTLTATPPAGGRFMAWSGDEACAGSNATLTFAVSAPVTCVASFATSVTITGAVGGGLDAHVTATSPDPHAVCAGSSCTADAGAAVTLVAPTIPGMRLTGWSGTGCAAGVKSGSGLTLTSSTSLTCTADYAPGVSVSGTVVGAVGQVSATSKSPDADCSSGICGLAVGGDVTLGISDIPGYRFTGWSGDAGCTGTSTTLPLTNVQTSIACNANFIRRLSVTGEMPSGLMGNITVSTVDPNGVCANGACTVDAGLGVQLSAPDVKGYRFVSWAGAGCSGNTQMVTLAPTDSDLRCAARYVLRVHATATASGATATFVYMSESTAASCDGTGCTVDKGSDVTLTAQDLAPGYRFIGWSGGTGCTGVTRAITLSDVKLDTACVATWIKRVTVNAGVEDGIDQAATIMSSDPNAVCADGACTVDLGQKVTLTAPTVDGVRFLGWVGEGPCQSSDNPLELVADDSLSCTASYVTQVMISATAGNATATITVDVCGKASSCIVDKGTAVKMSAPPVANKRFDHWSGDAPCTGIDPDLSFQVTLATACVANYVDRYTIGGVIGGGLMGGTISASSNDNNADCSAGSACVADSGKTVTLVASAIKGYRLTGWAGTGCTGTTNGNGITVTAAANVTCTANYALGVSVSGTLVGGDGKATVTATSSSPGATCDGMGTCGIDQGGSVTLTSDDLSNSGYRFIGWGSATGCSGTNLKLDLMNVQSSVSCSATWIQRFTVTGSPSGVTADSKDDPNKSCSGSACTVDSGKTVQLTAPPSAGHRFIGWKENGCGSTNPTTVTASANITCTAVYALTVNVSASASSGSPTLTATSSSAGAMCNGAACSLDQGGDVGLQTSDLRPGYRWGGWGGDTGCGGASLLTSVTSVQADTKCVAKWTQRFTVTGASFSGTVNASKADPNDMTASCTTSSCTVDTGKSVVLAAPDIMNYRFDKWSAGCGSDLTKQTTTVTPTKDITCTAGYVALETVKAVANSNGTVSASYSSNPVISCGSGTSATCVVDNGTAVTLAASPSATFFFDGWTGDAACAPANNPSITVSQTATCTASFVKFTISASTTDQNGNSVSAKIGANACANNTCVVGRGTTVTLTANNVDATKWVFDGWGGGGSCTGTSPLNLASQNAACTATWHRIYTVTASAVSNGSVSMVPSPNTGQCSGGTCTLLKDQHVTITPTPSMGYAFSGWTGASCPDNGKKTNPLDYVNMDASCAANFAAIPTYTVTAQTAPAGGPVVGVTGAGTCSTNQCTGVPDNSSVLFTLGGAVSGYTFKSWSANSGSSSACTGMTSPLTVGPIHADTTCTANYKITVSGTMGGSGTGTLAATVGGVACGNATCVVDPSTTVTFTVTPGDAGSITTSWSGGCVATSDPNVATITPTAPAACTATVTSEWAVSLGHVRATDNVASTDSAFAMRSLDSATVAIAGNYTFTDTTQVPPTTSYAIWTQILDVATGAVRVPNLLVGAFGASAGRAMLKANTSDMMVLADTTRNRPLLALLGVDGKIKKSLELPWVASGTAVTTNASSSLVAGTDGMFRVGSTVLFMNDAGSSFSRGRISAVASDLSSTGYKDFTICDDDQGAKGCGPCNPTSIIAMGEALGTRSYIVLLNSTVNGRIVALVDATGGVKWAKKLSGFTATIVNAVSMSDGSVAFVGYITEPLAKVRDAAVLWITQDGTPGFINSSTGAKAYAYTFGRAGKNERGIDGMDLKGSLLLAGVATNTATADDDVWLANISPDVAKLTPKSQFLYGGSGVDTGVSVAQLSSGFIIGGQTTSYGASTDLWAMRTASNFGLKFNAASNGHTGSTDVVAALTSIDPTDFGCVLTVALDQASLGGGAKTTIDTSATFARQAP